jgi:hypothetical protein
MMKLSPECDLSSGDGANCNNNAARVSSFGVLATADSHPHDTPHATLSPLHLISPVPRRKESALTGWPISTQRGLDHSPRLCAPSQYATTSSPPSSSSSHRPWPCVRLLSGARRQHLASLSPSAQVCWGHMGEVTKTTSCSRRPGRAASGAACTCTTHQRAALNVELERWGYRQVYPPPPPFYLQGQQQPQTLTETQRMQIQAGRRYVRRLPSRATE